MIMRYFTAEQYEKMQVRGSLVFYETEEDYEEQLLWWKAQGRDYEEMARDNQAILPRTSFPLRRGPLKLRLRRNE